MLHTKNKMVSLQYFVEVFQGSAGNFGNVSSVHTFARRVTFAQRGFFRKKILHEASLLHRAKKIMLKKLYEINNKNHRQRVRARVTVIVK